jgi:hypothetical protein
MKKFHVHHVSNRGYTRTVWVAVVMSVLVIVAAAGLGRATENFRAALTDKPDVAIYLLLPEEGLGNTTLLREAETERDYLADTKDGPKLIKLKKGEHEWFVSLIEPLHAGGSGQTGEQETETASSR